ncbi:hypothetical protein B0H14DRAFT_2612197 [Mycena olivaceomarginata]|nr:hypothetical protein B0H14DRAFT_2612197 [Mycena olivaceomarginata]
MTGLAEIAENSARARRVGNLEMNLLPEKRGIWVLTPQDISVRQVCATKVLAIGGANTNVHSRTAANKWKQTTAENNLKAAVDDFYHSEKSPQRQFKLGKFTSTNTCWIESRRNRHRWAGDLIVAAKGYIYISISGIRGEDLNAGTRVDPNSRRMGSNVGDINNLWTAEGKPHVTEAAAKGYLWKLVHEYNGRGENLKESELQDDDEIRDVRVTAISRHRRMACLRRPSVNLPDGEGSRSRAIPALEVGSQIARSELIRVLQV